MRIFIKTKVHNNLSTIHQKFDRNLFEKLSPPLMTVKVERFDGCLKDHEVHLLIQSLFVRNKWISKITTSELNEKVFYFIDEGIEIPPPLKKWKHIHRVEAIDSSNCYVIDDITYSSGSNLLDYALFPFLFGMFKFRQPIYKRELE